MDMAFAKDAGGGSPLEAAAPLKVLVVEDDQANGYVFTKFVEKLGHTSTLAASGAEAIGILSRERFDVVLMDIEMPGMDGFEATRLIRAGAAGPAGARTPVFALTAHSAWEGYEEKCRDAGMEGLLSKPLDMRVLGQVLDGVAAHGRLSGPNADAAAGGDEAVYDKAFALARFDGDQQLFDSFLEIVRQRYGQGLPELNQAAGQEDLAQFTRLAHSLKSVFSQLGAGRCRALAESLEHAGRNNDRATVTALLPELERELAVLMQAL